MTTKRQPQDIVLKCGRTLAAVLELHAAWWRGEAHGQRANLTGANLTVAILTRAVLTGANLTGAVLTDAILTTSVAVTDIDAAIISAISRDGCSLDMSRWHSCETTHCRAGWAITLAGEAGRVMEDLIGPNAAAALIYAASGSHPVPDWFASNEEAMADMRRRAGVPADQ